MRYMLIFWNTSRNYLDDQISALHKNKTNWKFILSRFKKKNDNNTNNEISAGIYSVDDISIQIIKWLQWIPRFICIQWQDELYNFA